MEVYYVEQQKATVLEKEFIYSTCWLIGMKLRSGAVQTLTPTYVPYPSPSFSHLLCPHFVYFLCPALPHPVHHFTSVLAQDPGGLPNGPRVWHRWRTLTSCRTPCRASCRQESFPLQVTQTGVLRFSQRPAAHPLNGTLRNLTVPKLPAVPLTISTCPLPSHQPHLQNKLEWRVVLSQII